jgi:CubicO group peptidase (beta-lactamase class C family)
MSRTIDASLPLPIAAPRRRGRLLRRIGRLVVAVGAIVAGVLLVAHLTTEYFFWSRIIAWRDSDFYDWQRFTARAVPHNPAAVSTIHPAPNSVPDALRQVTYRQDGRERIGPLDEMLASVGTAAFIVLRGDTLLYERYFNGYTRESTVTSFSTAKSFISALVGIAIHDGAIGAVDDPITRYLPELRGRPGLDRVTVRHLLTMSSGLQYSGRGSGGMPWEDDAKTYYAPDLRTLAFTVRAGGEPGTRWQYNNYHPLLLGLILERATGRPVAQYLSEKIWQPLGMEAPGSWSLDSARHGFEKMESGINGRAMDFARFGRLYARGGEWQGRQIVPRAWVEESTRPGLPTDPIYGYLWWLDLPEQGRGFSAAGHLGQFIYVLPEKDLVIVRFGERSANIEWRRLLHTIARRV